MNFISKHESIKHDFVENGSSTYDSHNLKNEKVLSNIKYESNLQLVIDMIDNKTLQQVHDDWKLKGFPYYPKDKKWRDNIFNQLINFKRDILIDRDNKVIGQSAHGLNLAWSYMKHAWGIKCGKMKTPIEVWDDED